MSEALLLLCDESTGNIFRVWPGLGAHEIEDEDDLRDVRKVAALEPIRSELARLTGRTGRLIVYLPCSECDGSGRYSGPDILWSTEWNRDEQGRMYREAPVALGRYHETFLRPGEFIAPGEIECDCCDGYGVEYHWTGERVALAPMVKGAA